MPVSGSTLVAAQRTMRLTTLSRAAPIAISLPDQVELVPGRPARRRRGWRGSAADAPARRSTFSIAATEARLMIDTTLAATSEKLWPARLQHLGRPAQLVGMKRRKNASIASRPSGSRGRRAPPRGRRRDDERVGRVLVSGCRSVARRSLRISIRYLVFGLMRGAAGSKPEGPFSIAYIGRPGRSAPGSSWRASSGSGRSPFTG